MRLSISDIYFDALEHYDLVEDFLWWAGIPGEVLQFATWMYWVDTWIEDILNYYDLEDDFEEYLKENRDEYPQEDEPDEEEMFEDLKDFLMEWVDNWAITSMDDMYSRAEDRQERNDDYEFSDWIHSIVEQIADEYDLFICDECWERHSEDNDNLSCKTYDNGNTWVS